MKNIGPGMLSLSLLLLLATFLFSCSKEEVNPSVTNTLSLDGQPFAVTMVSVMGISMDGEGHAAINFTGTDGTNTRSLAIDIEYAASQAISGTYSFPQASGARRLDDWLTNYTEFNGSAEPSSTNLKKGSVSVTDNGKSNYTFTIDLEMNDGKKFSGTYQGPVQEVFHNE